MLNQLELAAAIMADTSVVEPLGSYITIELFDNESTTAGGIVLPETTVGQEKQVLARVIRRGPGQRAISDGAYLTPAVEPGDIVIILKHAPIEVKLRGQKGLHVIAEGDIVAKVDPGKLSARQAPA